MAGGKSRKGELPRRTLPDGKVRGVNPLDFDDNDPSNFTPVTDFEGLTRSLGEIKRNTKDVPLLKATVDDMKPKVEATHTAMVRLETDHLNTKERVAVLERGARGGHDCYQVDTIRSIQEDGRETKAEVVATQRQVLEEIHGVNQSTTEAMAAAVTRLTAAETTLGAVAGRVGEAEGRLEKAGDKQDSGRRWLIGIGLTIVIFILGAVGGWIAMLYTIKADVNHLTTENTKLHKTVDTIRQQQASGDQAVTQKLQDVAQAVTTSNGHDHDADVPPIKVGLVQWCDIPRSERNRLKRKLPPDKIPVARCE